MTDDLAAFLDAVEGRAEAATPGPWAQGMTGDRLIAEVDYVAAFGLVVVDANLSDDGVGGIADAEFIAAARSDVPVLVAGWRKVLALCDDWQYERTVTAENLAYEIRAALVEALSPTPTPTAEETKT